MTWEEFEHGWRLAPAIPPADAPARALVVLLHGVGSNAQDLLPLADRWSETFPDVAFTSTAANASTVALLAGNGSACAT